ncbi:MAG: AmmeMemoRadiSam system protein B [Candidatus Schekmanbacteria bacterium]|nr:MAG: AmmeMemoRadiSam system protein B [Candidatus Schekmanbacteria bacterium]
MKHLKLIAVNIIFLLLFTSCGNAKEKGMVRPSVLAGSWYPADKDTLEGTIENYFESTKEKVKGISTYKPVALIEPHAGYIYSGKAAAAGYNCLKGKDIERVIILAPSHYAYFEGIALSSADYFETPLGRIPVEKAICSKLSKIKGFSYNDSAHSREHSIEIQLPFLQRALDNFSIIPLLVGEVEGSEYKRFADSIKPFINDKTIVIASSDFTHYGSRFGYLPFRKDIPENLKRIDMAAEDFILKKDSTGFIKYFNETGITICGRKPIAILLNLLDESAKGKLLIYYTSGEITGDYNNSVSYATTIFYDSAKKVQTNNKKSKRKESGKYLTEEEKKTLLKLSRAVLRRYLEGKATDDEFLNTFNITDKLREKRGVFVTLKRREMLRGCIGYVLGIEPLYKAVRDNTINAASRDPRFEPVQPYEEKECEIEISVLTVPEEMSDIYDFEIGKHGLIIEKGWGRGLLLPQVPVEYGWDKKTFLEQLCRKAGLPTDAYKSGAKLWRFEAEVFSEEDFK